MTYALACLCILVPALPVLLLGRLLGGLSTAILYSAFESWVLSSAQTLALPPPDVSAILGRATLLNGVVAAGAGVLSNSLVGASGSYAAPFVASGALLVVGYVVIQAAWGENYGAPDAAGAPSVLQLARLRQAWDIVRKGAPPRSSPLRIVR